MADNLRYFVPVELRQAAGGSMLRGIMLPEGRAAQGGRAEVFAPLSVVWPSEGVKILGEHRGATLALTVPIRDAGGQLRIETPATPAILEAYETRRFFSVEFHALREVQTAGGVREIQRALVEAAALVTAPEYAQAVAEVRARGRRRYWL